MRTYKVREVREYTGLSRKQLYDYEKSIPPVATENDAGYKLYDQEGLNKLSMAALFAELGVGPQRINDIFGAENYDRKQVLKDLILEAKRERQRLNDIIIVADYLKEFDLSQISYNPFLISNLHKMAESIRRDMKSDDVNKLKKNLDVEKEEKLLRIYKGFEAFDEKDAETEGTDKQVERLIDFIREDLEIEDWARILTGFEISLSSIGDYKEYIDNKTREGLSEYIAKAIFNYKMNKLFVDGEKYRDELEALDERDFKDPKVEKAVQTFMALLEKWFGFRSLSEAISIIQTMHYITQQDEEADADTQQLFESLFQALKYYEEKEHNA